MKCYQTAQDTMRHDGCNGTLRDYERIGDIMRHYEKSRDTMRQHETLRDIIDAMGQYETA